MERNADKQILYTTWMGNNLSYEGLKDVLKDSNSGKSKQPPPNELEANWNRLERMLSGRTA